MPVIQNFQAFIDGGGLVCPPDTKKIEFSLADEKGLFVECRASATAVPMWYLRLKNSGGTNVYKKLGTVKDISLPQARKLVKQIRAEHSVVLKSNAEPLGTSKGDIELSRYFYDFYLPHAKIHKRSWTKDLSLFKCHIGPRFGGLPLSAIKRLDVMAFHNEKFAGGLSASQSRHIVVLCRRLLGLACSWELLEVNVLKGVELVPLDNFQDTFLSEEETARLVQVLTTDSNKLVCAILLTLLNTGARKMEVMKAEWSHIELENRLWTVPSALSKNRKAKTMVLADSTVKILMSLDSRGKSKFVFPNPETGKPMTTISRVWYRLRKAAGINPKMRIHDTRACLAQRMLANNASIEVVARALGNNPSMAYARYARFSTKTMLDAANAGAIPMPQLEAPRLQEAANAGSVIVPRVEAKAA